MIVSKLSHVRYQRLPIKALVKLLIQSVIFVTTMVVGLAVLAYLLAPMLADVFGSALQTRSIIHHAKIAFVVLLLLYTLLSILQYRYTGFNLSQKGFAMRQGMLWQRETFVPRSRVQHIDIARSPMSRMLGLAKLQIYTAATKFGSVSLDGLDFPTAKRIRDELISNQKDTL